MIWSQLICEYNKLPKNNLHNTVTKFIAKVMESAIASGMKTDSSATVHINSQHSNISSPSIITPGILK